MIYLYVEFNGGWYGVRCNYLVDILKIIRRANSYTVGNIVEDKLRYVFSDLKMLRFAISIDVDERFVIDDLIRQYGIEKVI